MKFVPMFALIFVAFFVMAGIVVDGGRQSQTVQQALSIAQSAARAGTNAAAGTSVNGDAFDLSGPMAVTAAQNYLASAGVRGTARVAGDTVTVTVDMTYSPHILKIADIPIHVTRSARLIGN